MTDLATSSAAREPKRLGVWTGVVLWAIGAALASGTTAAAPGACAWSLELAGAAWLVGAVLGRRCLLTLRSALDAAAATLLLAVGLHAAGAALSVLHTHVVAGSSAATFLLRPVLGLLGLVGAPASAGGDQIVLQTMRDLYAFPLAWEKLAIFPGFLVVALGAGLVAVCRPRRPWRAIALLVVVVAAALVVRMALLVLAFHELMLHVQHESEYNFATLFWSPVALVLTFLPLGLVLERAVPLEAPSSSAAETVAPERARPAAPGRTASRARTASRRRMPKTVVAVALATACATAAVGFHDPGQRKPGRVLIDEGHSEWERVDRPYDTEWYGPDSGYNYRCIVDYLARFYGVTRTHAALDDSLLARHDVLILKIPTAEFTAAEIAAIVRWVRGGGGLLLIGDHTNVFGSGVYLNQIAEQVGFRFRYDCLFDIRRKFDQVYRRPRILPHPVVRHLPAFQFATSCSIEPTTLAYQGVIVSGGLKALDVDYSSSNFYPQVLDDPKMEFGVFLQMIGRTVGAGRVLGFTDSTVWSNFAAFHPGKAELFVASVDWLMRRNRWRWLNAVLAVAALALLAPLVLRAGRRLAARPVWNRSDALTAARLGGIAAIAWGATVGVLAALEARGYPPVAPRSAMPRVGFVAAASDMPRPSMSSLGDLTREFTIFYQWVQRLGSFPVWMDGGREFAPQTPLHVLVHPIRDPSRRDIERVTEYVRAGGRLLVIDGPGNFRSRSPAWLRPFGLDCERTAVVHVETLRDDAGRAYDPGARFPAWQVRGGEVWLRDGASGAALAAAAAYGRGTVVGVGFANLFCDEAMGGSQSAVPAPPLRQRYELEFELLRRLTSGPGAAPPTASGSLQP